MDCHSTKSIFYLLIRNCLSRFLSRCPYLCLYMNIGLSCRLTLLRSSLIVSFSASTPSSHIYVPVCHFHTYRISYFLTISSYFHHYILCRLLRFDLVCRLSSVPLQRGLALSSGRA